MQAYAYFESIEQEIVRLLGRAQISVRICVAWIRPETFQPVFEKLAARGVRIDLIYNDDSINNNVDQMQYVARLHPRKARGNRLMHNKFCIIDERTVITGSYNWSRNAANHFENIVVIEDNFSLVKDYLHEFHDLLELDFEQAPSYCPTCRSVTFNVAVLGDESGKYAESAVDLWSICSNNSHARHLGVMHESFLEARLGLNEEHDFPADDLEDRTRALSYFERERKKIRRIQSYLTWRQATDSNGYTRPFKLHAVGQVFMKNSSEFIKGYATTEEWVLGIGWRDRWMRRHIPTILPQWWGSICEIIDSQRGRGVGWSY